MGVSQWVVAENWVPLPGWGGGRVYCGFPSSFVSRSILMEDIG